MSYFPEPHTHNKNKIEAEWDLSNYATKSDLKNATNDDTTDFAKKADLPSLKPDVDKLDSDKLKNVPSGFNSLKSKVDKLDIGKLESAPVDLSKLSYVGKSYVVKKTEYDKLVKKVNNIKTTDTSDIVKKADCNTKTNEIEKKITDQDYSNKYITVQEFNRLTANNFAARLKQENLTSKNDITDFIKNISFDEKTKYYNKTEFFK